MKTSMVYSSFYRPAIGLVIIMLLSVASGCSEKDDTETPVVPSTVTDADGNVYHTITIGTQVWMVENLRTTKYRNGDPITHLTDDVQWVSTSDGAYCAYSNMATLGSTYGMLYNWYAVDDSRQIAPTGWHVPSDAEWTTLVDFLGGEATAGGKMKETGEVHWASPNTGATNSSGFTALSGGFRANNGYCTGLSGFACFWTSTENYPETSAWYRGLYSESAEIGRNIDFEKNGFYVRCLKD